MDEKELNEKQKKFVEHLFFQTAWNVATQHNGIWNDGTTERVKRKFKRAVKEMLVTMLAEYKNPVTPEKHMENIKKLQTLASENGERLDTGKSQKILNVMCKFYWCNGWITTPPHLTIDQQILNKLSGEYAELKNVNWTELNDETYAKIIKKAYEFTTSRGYAAPVEWELENWRNTLDS